METKNTKLKQTMANTNIIDSVVKTPRSDELVRKSIPILVDWATSGRTEHTYGDLIHEFGMTRFSGIGRLLGYIELVLKTLKEQSGEKIPSLNALLVDSRTGLPSDGFDVVDKAYSTLTDEEKRLLVKGYIVKIVQYPKWHWVLDELGLQPIVRITEEELDCVSRQVHHDGGEGEEHRAIKAYIQSHPECLGITNVVASTCEHPLPSGDRLDVFLETGNIHYAIEVKPSTSPDSDILRGIFQCVKYKAVLKAMRVVTGKSFDSEAILVTTGKLSNVNREIANQLNVKYIELPEFPMTDLHDDKI